MARHLLAYLSRDYTNDDVEALKSLINSLSTNGVWTNHPPEFVDQFEEDSRTAPEDEPVRTVGLVLLVNSAGEAPATPVSELSLIVDALSTFSKGRNVDFELQLGNTFVGQIESGVPDKSVLIGLLANW